MSRRWRTLVAVAGGTGGALAWVADQIHLQPGWVALFFGIGGGVAGYLIGFGRGLNEADRRARSNKTTESDREP